MLLWKLSILKCNKLFHRVFIAISVNDMLKYFKMRDPVKSIPFLFLLLLSRGGLNVFVNFNSCKIKGFISKYYKNKLIH